jgi:uncharacterized protein YacL
MKFLGLGSVLSLLVVCFLLEKFGGVKPTVNVKNRFEYVPILTANIIADLLIIYLTFTRLFYQTSTLEIWYKKYRLSAMIADILIGVLYLLLARYIVSIFHMKIGLTAFALLAVTIQVIFDFLFYLFFTAVPKGNNAVLDFFKSYAEEVKTNALFGDSFLVVFAVMVSGILLSASFDVNIVTLIISLYLIPFFVYMKD